MIYVYYLDVAFEDIAEMISEGLDYYKIENKMITSMNNDKNDLYIILGIGNSLVRLPKKYIAYQFEQTGNEKSWFTESYINKLKGSIEIWDYSIKNIQNCKKYGITNVEYVPLGYSKKVDRIPIVKTKEYDVLFYGSSCPRRDKLMENMRSMGINVYYSTYKLWGKERDMIIAKSRIVLNVHFYENPILETARISYLINNKVFVISERSQDPILDRQYNEYLVFCDYSELIVKCLYYLKHEDEMIEIVNKGYNEFKKRQYYENMPIKNIIKNIEKVKEGVNMFNEAEINISEEGEMTLKIGKQLDEIPMVSIITPTHNRSWCIDLCKRNFYGYNYPADKLEWIILESDPTEKFVSDDPRIKYEIISNDIPLWQKRNMCVERSIGKIIIHMDDDDYYYPESILAKVKLLDKYNNINCVGCTELGIYHLIENYSYIMNTKYLSEASMAYRKEFWLKRPFIDKKLEMGEGYSFIENRENECMTFPHYFNLIAITHNKNYTNKLRTINVKNDIDDNFFNNWDIQTQWFFLKLKQIALNN